jgi:hypothetical protein
MSRVVNGFGTFQRGVGGPHANVDKGLLALGRRPSQSDAGRPGDRAASPGRRAGADTDTLAKRHVVVIRDEDA